MKIFNFITFFNAIFCHFQIIKNIFLCRANPYGIPKYTYRCVQLQMLVWVCLCPLCALLVCQWSMMQTSHICGSIDYWLMLPMRLWPTNKHTKLSNQTLKEEAELMKERKATLNNPNNLQTGTNYKISTDNTTNKLIIWQFCFVLQ